MKTEFSMLLVLAVAAVFLSGCSEEDTSTKAMGFDANVKDSAVCMKLNNSASRSTCLGVVAGNTKDAAVCEQINSPLQKNVCYSEAAKKMKDPKVCGMISDESISGICLNNLK